MSKNFAITGVAGYIAPRHLKAIKDTGNKLIAALDTNDSVGVMDKYFFESNFFKEFERFERHAEKMRRHASTAIEYVSICTPNYLHDAHIRFALRIGAHAICEKPLVLNPWNVDALEEYSANHGPRIYNVLQLRLHPRIIALKKEIAGAGKDSIPSRIASGLGGPLNGKREIELAYVTARGKWYLSSWKGNMEQSGGLGSNIGIHFFDMLIWIFGDVEFTEVHHSEPHRLAGYLELKNARVKWYLSIDPSDVPDDLRANGATTFRSLTMDGKEIEFSDGFADLHTAVYKDILDGGGYGPSDARPSIQLAHNIRNAKPTGSSEHSHPFLLRKR